MKIGYDININGTHISHDGDNPDLISLMNTNDTEQLAHSLDIIIGNKDRKYNYRFTTEDPVSAILKLYSDTDSETPVYSKQIFNGFVGTINWDYMTMHIIAQGSEAGFNLGTAKTMRVYRELSSREQYDAIVMKLVEDYNDDNKSSPISGFFDLGKTPVPKIDIFEVQANQNVETIMDNIDTLLGCSHWCEVVNGQTILFLGDRSSMHQTEPLIQELGANLIYDSAAVNEIGYVTEVKVFGSPQEYNEDDRNLQGTRSCWGKAWITNVENKSVRHVSVNDPTCHNPDECCARALHILQQSCIAKDTIKPVFVNVAPSVGSKVTYQDPTYPDIQISGQVLRRELRVSATEGWICTVELALSHGVNDPIFDSYGENS